MDNDRWLEEAMFLAQHSAEYGDSLERLAKLEPKYRKLLARLSKADQQLVEDYIMACEALDDSLAHCAYRLGMIQATSQTCANCQTISELKEIYKCK